MTGIVAGIYGNEGFIRLAVKPGTQVYQDKFMAGGP